MRVPSLLCGLTCSLLTSLMILCAGVGCSEEGEATGDLVAIDERRLVDNFVWVPVDTERDPFWGLATEPVMCSEEAHAPDPEIGEVWYTVETRTCNYLSVEQPLLEAIEVGQQVELRVYQSVHVTGNGFSLGIAFGDRVAMREGFPGAPAGSGTRLLRWTATENIPAGTRVIWNVSNDGVNSWSIMTLNVLSSGAVDIDD